MVLRSCSCSPLAAFTVGGGQEASAPLPARLFPERHPRDAPSSASRTASSRRAGRRGRRYDPARSTPARRRGDLLRRARRDIHRAQPGHQRLRPVRRRGDPDHRRRDLRRVPSWSARRSRPRTTWPARRLATPQLGNTQDVALRAWLLNKGSAPTRRRRRRVDHSAGQRPDARDFITGDIDGAWVPEPWATRMVLEGGGKSWSTSGPVARRRVRDHPPHGPHRLSRGHPDVVKRLLQAHIEANALVNEDPAARRRSSRLPSGAHRIPEPPQGIWPRRLGEPRVHPRSDRLVTPSIRGKRRGRRRSWSRVDLDGIYDLTLLNELLRLGRTGGARAMTHHVRAPTEPRAPGAAAPADPVERRHKVLRTGEEPVLALSDSTWRSSPASSSASSARPAAARAPC